MTQQENTLRRDLGTTGLRCHPVGFGCYRIQEGNQEHEASLRQYLDRGGNLIDTSANYTDGQSERLVGRVLADYPRRDIVLVTKGGYIQGQNMALAKQMDFPEVVRYGPGIWHCIHPEFLWSQIQRSLERMRTNRIDVYLLHNPEYFLTDKEHRGTLSEKGYEEFYRRIHEAFHFLENEVVEGRIRWYGISSNNFGFSASQAARTSVELCLQQAQALNENHHFRVVQLPLNLYEVGGALESNNQGKSVLQYCKAEGIGVLANRPLNAFAGGRMVRLADSVQEEAEEETGETLSQLLEPLRSLEGKIAKELQIPRLGGGDKGLAEVIEEIVPRIQSSAHWENVVNQNFLPPLQSWLGQEAFRRDARGQALQAQYLELIQSLLEQVGRYCSRAEQGTSARVREAVHAAGYPRNDESLSRMALNVLLSLEGLSCVLTGMRQRPYVEDAMGAAALPEVDGIEILRKLGSELEK